MTEPKDFKENLQKFIIPQARMLYMIYHLYQINEINFTQKCKLKEFVITENKTFLKIHENFEKSMNIQKLINDIQLNFFEDKQAEKNKTIDVKSLQIITNKEQLKKPVDVKKDENQNGIQDLTSPLASLLVNKKKRNQKKMTNTNLNEIKLEVDECEVGMSPKVVINKDIKSNKHKSPLENAVGHLNKNLK
jgi:hypothetical protein